MILEQLAEQLGYESSPDPNRQGLCEVSYGRKMPMCNAKIL